MIKVVTFGTFDPLHKGHEEFLKQAKILGDYLVVVVSPDDKINLEKKRMPRDSDQNRLRRVKKLNLADEVIMGEKGKAYSLLDKIAPNIIALGYDQRIPEPLKNQVRKYKIVTLKPFKPETYKSSKIV